MLLNNVAPKYTPLMLPRAPNPERLWLHVGSLWWHPNNVALWCCLLAEPQRGGDILINPSVTGWLLCYNLFKGPLANVLTAFFWSCQPKQPLKMPQSLFYIEPLLMSSKCFSRSYSINRLCWTLCYSIHRYNTFVNWMAIPSHSHTLFLSLSHQPGFSPKRWLKQVKTRLLCDALKNSQGQTKNF